MSLLEVTGLTKSFPARPGLARRARLMVPAVRDVSFRLEAGETMALVGESGAGKSTVGRLVLRLIDADTGSIVFDGTAVHELSRKQMRPLRRRMQIIFQDPYSSLDPRLSVGESVAEPLLVHFGTDRAERRRIAGDLLERVGLRPADMTKLPSELSGGQLQRASIARALTVQPELIVCDESLSALDVSVRAQVVTLLQDLQEELGLAYLFISHDLGLVEVIADHVVVMSAGCVVEAAAAAQLFAEPSEEYTRRLLAATPIPIPRRTTPSSAALEAADGDRHE